MPSDSSMIAPKMKKLYEKVIVGHKKVVYLNRYFQGKDTRDSLMWTTFAVN